MGESRSVIQAQERDLRARRRRLLRMYSAYEADSVLLATKLRQEVRYIAFVEKIMAWEIVSDGLDMIDRNSWEESLAREIPTSAEIRRAFTPRELVVCWRRIWKNIENYQALLEIAEIDTHEHMCYGYWLWQIRESLANFESVLEARPEWA